jgi:hypothetical protein
VTYTPLLFYISIPGGRVPFGYVFVQIRTGRTYGLECGGRVQKYFYKKLKFEDLLDEELMWGPQVWKNFN